MDNKTRRDKELAYVADREVILEVCLVLTLLFIPQGILSTLLCEIHPMNTARRYRSATTCGSAVIP